MVLQLPDKWLCAPLLPSSFMYFPPKKNVLSSCSVRLALHVPRRAPLKLCRLSWVPSTNYVPTVLKFPTSSQPHGVGLDLLGGIRPVLLSFIYSSTLTIFKGHLHSRPQCPREKVVIPFVQDTK